MYIAVRLFGKSKYKKRWLILLPYLT
jgi:hypothetical protein